MENLSKILIITSELYTIFIINKIKIYSTYK